MSTEFISLLTPPGDSIAAYNRSLPPSDQPSSVPQLFIEAMAVREEVFVLEQKVPLENELDEDDAKSFHWVVYASVGASRSAPKSDLSLDATTTASSDQSARNLRTPSGRKGSKDSASSRGRSHSTASRVPVGTIRLVPPPSLSSSSRKTSNASEVDSDPASRTETPTTAPRFPHPSVFPTEPYVRLGRLATLSPYRGLGLSKLLITAALNYARFNAKIILPPQSAAEVESAKLHGRPVQEPWKGLVVVHAQEDGAVSLWKRWGFEMDEGMGRWEEEGMMHVGMWKRLELPEKMVFPPLGERAAVGFQDKAEFPPADATRPWS